jgi:hypothetical protein
VPYDVKSAAIYIMAAGLLIYLAFSVSFENQVVATAFHLLLCLVFAAIVFVLEKPQLRMSKVSKKI